MMLARTNMKNLHQRRTEANQGPHRIEADHLLETRKARTRRSNHASFGNKGDAIGAVSVDSVMMESNPNHPVLQRLPGLRRVIRERREAGVPAEVGIAMDRSPKTNGNRSPKNSRPTKGNKGKPDTPIEHPQRQFASSHRCLHPFPTHV